MMTIKDLKEGDIIINRIGQVGLYTVRKNEGYIIYQDGGYDIVDCNFSEDMTDLYDGPNFDIMQVYREYFGGMICFSDYEEADLVFERDETWKNPNAQEELPSIPADESKDKPSISKDSIAIISQFFYGNRTGTIIKRKNVKSFIQGHLDDNCPLWAEEIDAVDLQTVLVPGTENVVIVYDQHSEENYINVDFPEIYARDGKKYLERWGEELKPHVSCEIPELNFKIHTRCFACRIDENGEFQSLEAGDADKFIEYFFL